MIEIKITNEFLDNEFNYMEVSDNDNNITCKGDIIHLNIKGVTLGLDVRRGTIRLFNYSSDKGKLKLADSLSDTAEVTLK